MPVVQSWWERYRIDDVHAFVTLTSVTVTSYLYFIPLQWLVTVAF